MLPQFSDKVSKRKILPSLLEETRKNMLVPFLLPCIFYIGERMENVCLADELRCSGGCPEPRITELTRSIRG